MISIELARKLRDSGLRWDPVDGDRFVVPDRGLDHQVFTISDMTVAVREAAGGQIIAFNGTVEWALDSINQWEVVWLPREAQLRDELGDTFVALERRDGGFRCVVEVEGRRVERSHPDASEAYGLALLEVARERTRRELASLGSRRLV